MAAGAQERELAIRINFNVNELLKMILPPPTHTHTPSASARDWTYMKQPTPVLPTHESPTWSGEKGRSQHRQFGRREIRLEIRPCVLFAIPASVIHHELKKKFRPSLARSKPSGEQNCNPCQRAPRFAATPCTLRYAMLAPKHGKEHHTIKRS